MGCNLLINGVCTNFLGHPSMLISRWLSRLHSISHPQRDILLQQSHDEEVWKHWVVEGLPDPTLLQRGVITSLGGSTLLIRKIFFGWWLNQPNWKICASQIGFHLTPVIKEKNPKNIWRNHQNRPYHLSRPTIDLQHANRRDVLHMDPNKPSIVPSRAAHLGPEFDERAANRDGGIQLIWKVIQT